MPPSLLSWPLCSWAHWMMPGERCLLASTEWGILSIWLSNPLLRSPFNEHSNETQISSFFFFFAHAESSTQIPLSQTSLSPISYILSKSLTIQPNHWLQSMNEFTITPLAIAPTKYNKQPGSLHKVCPLGGFPFTTILQGHPRSSQVVPQYRAEPTINQTWVFSSSVNR